MPKTFKFYLLIQVCSIVLFFGCEHNKKNISKTVPQKKQSSIKKDTFPILKKVKEIKKETDTINKTNAVSFLKAYGNIHQETLVLFKTRLGMIKIKLYRETPLHRASFIFLTKTGYFNTTSFHRIVPDFIVQGGNSDFPKTRELRMKYNYKIPAEIKKFRKHKYGALAAARQWENNPDKISSPFEFYIIQDKNGSHHLDGEHTIFGEIIEGFSTIEKISRLETDKKEWPLNEVFINAEVLK